jgi:hypothetical protein
VYPDVFTSKLAGQGRLAPETSTKALTASPAPISNSRCDQALKTAPRLVSDQLINIFFQEWAPLYPVVHRPTILKTYEQYLSNSETFQGNKHEVAQLNLIFAVAALSAKVSFIFFGLPDSMLISVIVENKPRSHPIRGELVADP